MNQTNGTGGPPMGTMGTSLARKVISSFAISVLIILTLFGNSLVIAAFYRYRRIRNSVTNWFILSLAISDLLVACLSEPFWLSIEITEWENFPENFNYIAFAKFWVMLDIVCAVSSIVNLMFISIDRYFAIKSPLVHHTKMGPETAKWIIPALWGYSLLTALVAVPDEWYWMVLTLFIMGFLVPLLVMVVCYSGILHVVVTKSRAVEGRMGRRMNREFKTAKSLGVVTGAFVVCWLPFHVASLANQYCLACQVDIQRLRSIPSAVKWLHYLNSCLNPIIYAFLNPTFKLAFKNLFKRCARKPETFDDSSYSWSFRRRGTKSSIGSFSKQTFIEDSKANGQLPNGKDKTSLLRRKQSNNGSISSEGGGKKASEANSLDCGSALDEPLLESRCAGPGDKPVAGNSPDQQLIVKRSVSFTEHPELLKDEVCEAEDEVFVESPLFRSKLSTFLDQARNQYCFLVDGIMVPDEDIKCSDV